MVTRLRIFAFVSLVVSLYRPAVGTPLNGVYHHNLMGIEFSNAILQQNSIQESGVDDKVIQR